ncbi:MAG: hypothetical protein ACYC3N_08475 [Halothiobacillus sp.]
MSPFDSVRGTTATPSRIDPQITGKLTDRFIAAGNPSNGFVFVLGRVLSSLCHDTPRRPLSGLFGCP